MTLPVEINPMLLGSGVASGYDLSRSVRLRAAASASLSRVVGTPTSQNVWTYNAWVKLGNLTVDMPLINTGTSGSSNYERLRIVASTGVLTYLASNSATSNFLTKSTSGNLFFRDPSAWYNIHVIKTASANSSVNCLRIWINNIEVTTWGTNAYTGTQASVPDAINVSGSTLILGTSNSANFDGYFANVNFVDGLALDPEAFITMNTGNGMAIKPKIYTGAFGANGFWLTFTDNSGITATTIGKDTSGNGNNFTPSGISITSGTTYDSMIDVPTLTNPTIANYPTLSQLTLGTSCVLTEGNLTATWTTITSTNGISTQSNFPIPRTGKYYFEVLVSTNVSGSAGFGILPINTLPTKGTVGFPANSYALRPGGAGSGTMRRYSNNTLSSWGAAPAGFGTGVVYGVAIDMTAGAIYFRDATGWMNSSNSNDTQPTSAAFTGIAGDYVPAVGHISSIGSSSAMSINFGQRPFTHAVPTGYLRLNTYNIPDSAVPKSDTYFNSFYYTGNGNGLQIGETQRPLALYPLNASLRFRPSASATLTRTLAVASNRTTWTRSMWVKKTVVNLAKALHGVNIDANNREFLDIGSSTDVLTWTVTNLTAGGSGVKRTSQVFRDASEWIHIVQIWDTTNSNAEDRMQLWVDGIRMTIFDLNTQPPLNLTSYTNSTIQQTIGSFNGTNFWDGYIAEVHFVDGTALTASSFGQFDGNGYWVPKQYTGSYGTQGYRLTFEDRTGNTATTIGKDTSGNGNNWTPTGVSVTAGIDYDGINDVPTNTSLTVANFNVLVPSAGVITISSGGLNASNTGTSAAFAPAINTVPSTGKYYWEYVCTNTNASPRDIVGFVVKGLAQERLGASLNSFGYSTVGTINQTGSFNTWGQNDVIGVAIDCDTGKVWFGKQTGGSGSMVWQGSGDPAGGTNQNYTIYDPANWVPAVGVDAASGLFSINGSVNFGQRAFSSAAPSGFKMLNSYNADELSGDLEKPDFVWIKQRSSNQNHALFTSVIGIQKYVSTFGTALIETTDANSLVQFNKNGFLLSNSALVNAAAATYMGAAWRITGGTTSWNFDGTLGRTATMTTADPCVVSVSTNAFAAGQAVRFTTDGALPSPITTGVTYYAGNILTNTTFNLYDTEANAILGGATGRISTAGSSQSGTHTCRHAVKIAANPTVGVSVLTYCGSGVDGATIGHGLGATPNFFMVKCRNTTATNFPAYHSGMTSPAHTNLMLMNSTARDVASTWLSNTAPTSSVITLGLTGNASDINVSGRTYQLIAFTEIPGFSKFTTYLSNNSTDGPYVNCGFRPKWVIIKAATVIGGWIMFDVSRLPQNTNSRYLFAEAATGDASLGGGTGLDFTASGFKIRTTTVQVNTTSDTVYTVMAFAENPFKYALAR